MGKTVKTIVVPNQTFDVSDLTKGIYFLQIQVDEALVSKVQRKNNYPEIETLLFDRY